MMIPKFRCWDEPNKIMRFNDEIVIWNDQVYINEKKELNSRIKGYSRLSEHLMQSTGLKDKNGVEIFEGDVVRIGTLETTPIGAIEFDKSNACFAIPNNKKYVFGGEYVTSLHAKYFEVIGDIYTNPELLEEE